MGSSHRLGKRRGTVQGLGAALVLATVLAAVGCDSDNGVKSLPDVESVTIVLRYSGPRYAGSFYSSFLPATDAAVWLETAAGEHVETLMVTPTVVSVGDYSHVDHLPSWQAATGLTYADLEAETDRGVAPSFDSLTRASILFAAATVDTTVTLQWVPPQPPPGTTAEQLRYRFCAEVGNIVKDDAAAYQIVAESTCGTLDLAAVQALAAPPTSHILELRAAVAESAGE